MFEQVTAALEQNDLNLAVRILKQWTASQPKDPWLQMAVAQYREATDELDKAETLYLKLLKTTTSPKLMAQARQGIQRIRDRVAQQQEHDLEQSNSQPGAEETSLLILEPVSRENREAAAQGLAQVMQLDGYSARLLIPSKQWRLYRLGKAGELQYFCRALSDHHTPAFTASLSAIRQIPVFRVQSIQTLTPQVSVICQNSEGQLGSLNFDWTEITQTVLGLLPIFESVVDLGAWGKLKRKEATQDYAEVLDLHFHGRSCVLRLCDRTYQHKKGVSLDPGPEENFPVEGAAQTSNRRQWMQLKKLVVKRTLAPQWTDFSHFGEGSLEFMNLLPDLPTHIELKRKAPSYWDLAFQLYSMLRFLRFSQTSL